MNKVLYRGAEANIFLKGDLIVKERVSKGYRLKKLDEKIRKLRTRAEKRILEKASKLIACPKPIETKDDYKVVMPFIDGKKLSESLDDLKNSREICKEIGKNLAKIHDADIIHGDLTTSNMIFFERKVYFIDFGLGFHSARFEDKAVDLHLIKQALEAKHFVNADKFYRWILEGYNFSRNYKNVLKQLEKVEKRGRYR